MTTPIPPYVVLLPGRLANPTDKHLVVHVDEWVHLLLKEKETYTFANEHDTYESAASERDQLNHRPEGMTQPWPSDEQSPTEVPPPSATVVEPSAPPPPPSPRSDEPPHSSAPAVSRKRRRLGNGRKTEAEAS